MDNGYLELSIRSREGSLFEGKVRSITSYNNKGKFDILPQHANFISLLKKEVVYVDEEGNDRALKIESALLRKKDLVVEIYIGVKSFSEAVSDKEKQIDDVKN